MHGSIVQQLLYHGINCHLNSREGAASTAAQVRVDSRRHK
jgi:hypothetical protein